MCVKSRFLLVLGLSVLVTGCNRAFYRRDADAEALCVISEKSDDPRWAVPGFSIELDPRSRYYDPYDPDRPPMPQDDPYSHRYMHCVDGMRGWKKWHQFGTRPQLENPNWEQHLSQYVPVNDDGEIVLSLDTALRLAYMHSPEYQQTLETVFLSALDVTTERFRLDTQFFGGNDTTFTHLGRLRPGGEQNTLRTDTDFELRRRFATAGELLVGFANEFVWTFAGPDTNSTNSILNFVFLQPLLRGAGQDIALEQLTIVERGLLANLRAFARFRQGFFTDVAVGSGGVQGPQRRGGFFGGTGLTGFTGQGAGGLGGVGAATGFGRGGFGGGGGGATGGGAGFAGGGAGAVGGFIGLLQTLQEIRNTQASLNAQIRTLNLLEASLEAGVIDLTQVDQFRQSIETERANLLQAENGLLNSLESYKTGTLGLPPDLPITLDDSLIEPFQLIDATSIRLQGAIADLQTRIGEIGARAERALVAEALESSIDLEQQFQVLVDVVQQDLEFFRQRVPQRKETLSDVEARLLEGDVQRLNDSMTSLEMRYGNLADRRDELAAALAADAAARQVLDDLVVWLRDLLGIVQELSLVQARARLESVVVEPIELDSERAFEIALSNRLDLMNNRAALVDSWRLIQFNADSLQSNLDVFFEGDVQTTGNNPLKFRGPTGSLRAGVRFDAPFTRLLERNNYRQQLIEYQQDRRQLIQIFDGLKQTLRSLLRQIEQLQVNLEIQRRAVVIAIRRVDVTREELNEPQAPPEPGQPASQLGPTAATNSLTALSDLRNVQNNFMSVYLNYYATRMILERELGVMMIDNEGRWVDAEAEPASSADEETDEMILPPPVPEQVLRQIMPDAGSPPADSGMVHEAWNRQRAMRVQ